MPMGYLRESTQEIGHVGKKQRVLTRGKFGIENPCREVSVQIIFFGAKVVDEDPKIRTTSKEMEISKS